MNDKLIELIRQRGYWRINFRPVAVPAVERPLVDCLDIVNNAMVQLRGWYYPHVPVSPDESGGIDHLGDCIQAWSSWSWHLEFWRMYSSEQFLHYITLNEDWRHENCNVLSHIPGPPEARRLGVTGSTWLITEVFEFLFRLSQQGAYSAGAQVSIQLHNARGRKLYIDEINRIPFVVEKETQAEPVEYSAILSAEKIEQPKSMARAALFHIYDRFGWRPNVSQIDSEIERLYTPNRTFG